MSQSSSAQKPALPQSQKSDTEGTADQLETSQESVDNSGTATQSPGADNTELQLSKATSSAAPQADDWGDFVS